MTSSGTSPDELFVWTWLPGATEPVVAGRLSRQGKNLRFNYGQSYLARDSARPLYAPELPLRAGLLPLGAGLAMPSCLRDASPDAWGRRVIINRFFGNQGKGRDNAALDEMTYLLASGSNRIGALDFQRSASEYIPRVSGQASLEELLASAERVEQGEPLSADLDLALNHGTSIGGARPKALLDTAGKHYVAKFSSSSDVYSVVKAEFVAMRLAKLAGLTVAPVQLARAAGKDVLLIERFDRLRSAQGWQRKAMVSALTLFGLDEMMARYASYEDLAEIIRRRFEQPADTLRELFKRLVFNVLCGNTDDHARNHAAFWDGECLSLTPAYDICPQPRIGNEASHAMLIHGNQRLSNLANCRAACTQFLLAPKEADRLIEQQVQVIHAHWADVCEEAELSQIDRQLFWQRQFLNPSIFQG